MKLSSIRKDVNKSVKGVWVSEVYGDLDVKVAEANNKEYTAKIREILAPHRHKAKIPEKFVEDAINRATAEHILLDWRNLQDDEGNDIAYSKEKSLEIMTSPEWADLRDIITGIAQTQELYRVEGIAATANKS